MLRLSNLCSTGITFLLATTFVHASSLLDSRQSITPLSPAQIAAFKPYSYYAAAAYCSAASTLSWTCGISCTSTTATFTPTFSGGDGSDVQYWYTGYDSALETVIVGHQGTHDIVPVLTDADFFLVDLDSSLFPGLNSSQGIQVHNGFGDQQAKTAQDVLAAVQSTLANFSATSVTVVGHSSGGAIALLDAVYLPLHLPSAIKVSMIAYAVPRVGNQEFADYVDAHLPSLVARVNNMEDIVPILPGRFLGFHHPSGEVHINDDGSWVSCPGQDNPSTECSTGDVPTIFDGNASYHKGPYDGVMMSTSTCGTS